MTVTHTAAGGYLDQEYLDNQYLDAIGVLGSMGQQANFVVSAASKKLGQQATFGLTQPKPLGQQATFALTNAGAASESGTLGQQAHFSISSLGAAGSSGAKGQQALISISSTGGSGSSGAKGQQAKFALTNAGAGGESGALGQQVYIVNLATIGMQALFSNYNTKRLRILCDFPSRGLSSFTGVNAWGNLGGQGLNWRASNTESGDFDVKNLNTDLVEQQWRSADTVVVSVNLDCDTEREQGVYLDTLAILEHNLTSDATVVLRGADNPGFSPIGVNIPLTVRDDDPNIYYVAPALPTTGYRYWRLSIDNAGNPDDHLSIGTVVFGAASVFSGECFVDEVEFQLKDYADLVNTEGFTNVANSRAQKKLLRLEFRSLAYLKSNFRIMRRMFREERTVLKCLWIPTPDPVNQEYSARFAVFSKLSQIPAEKHNHKGGEADYVTFSIELDESK